MPTISSPTFSELVSQCRENIAVNAGQHVGTRLTDDELKQTPEKHYQGQETQWIQKFKATVVPSLHGDAKYGHIFKKFVYNDAYAKKSFKDSFNRTAIDISTKVYVSLEGEEINIEEWLGS